MLRRSGREQLLGRVRSGRACGASGKFIDPGAKGRAGQRRELRLSSASEGNRDERQGAVMEAGGLQISCDGDFTGASAGGGQYGEVLIARCINRLRGLR